MFADCKVVLGRVYNRIDFSQIIEVKLLDIIPDIYILKSRKVSITIADVDSLDNLALIGPFRSF